MERCASVRPPRRPHELLGEKAPAPDGRIAEFWAFMRDTVEFDEFFCLKRRLPRSGWRTEGSSTQ
jgi:hypothetical protein